MKITHSSQAHQQKYDLSLHYPETFKNGFSRFISTMRLEYTCFGFTLKNLSFTLESLGRTEVLVLERVISDPDCKEQSRFFLLLLNWYFLSVALPRFLPPQFLLQPVQLQPFFLEVQLYAV